MIPSRRLNTLKPAILPKLNARPQAEPLFVSALGRRERKIQAVT
jgi:hypothetical protein